MSRVSESRFPFGLKESRAPIDREGPLATYLDQRRAPGSSCSDPKHPIPKLSACECARPLPLDHRRGQQPKSTDETHRKASATSVRRGVRQLVS